MVKGLIDNWAKLFILLGGISASLSGIWSVLAKENWFLSGTGVTFVISIIMNCVGSIKVWQDTPANRILQGEVARLEDRLARVQQDYFRTFELQLETLYNELRFADTERISLYIHKDKNFTMIARYSINPRLYERGRVLYPDNEGCIGHAWSNGKAFENNSPDLLRNEAQYIEHMRNKWNMSEATIHSLTMKSRNLAAYAINNLQKPAKRVAVIVFESLERNKITENSLNNVFTGNNIRHICQLLETMKSLEPSPKNAKKEGY